MSRLQRVIADAIKDAFHDDLSDRDTPRPKTIYTKEFSDETEFREFVLDVVNVHKWKSVVWELDQKFRAQVKYNCNPRTLDETDVWQEARDLLRELLNSEGLEFP